MGIISSKSGVTFKVVNPNEPVVFVDNLSNPERDEILRAYKALGLCQLSYAENNNNPQAVQLVERFGIQDYNVWEGQGIDILGVNRTNIAITGLIPYLTDKNSVLVPFVCFRGTIDLSDFIDDAEIIIPDKFKSSTGDEIGLAGRGLVEYYESLKLTTKNKQNLPITLLYWILSTQTKYPDVELLITGHSLGAAGANLLAADLYTDNKAFLNLQLITFGCPKTFGRDSAEIIHKFPYVNHRYVNDGDLITTIGGTLLYNIGIPIYHPDFHSSFYKSIYSLKDNWCIIPIDHSFDWTLDDSYIKSATHCIGNLITKGLKPHLIDSSKGYSKTIFESDLYQNAYNSITDVDIKRTFDRLPLKILPWIAKPVGTPFTQLFWNNCFPK